MNCKSIAFAAFLVLFLAPFLLADTVRENDTPRFIQTTTSPGINQLALESDFTGGDTGTDWSVINFTGESATLFGPDSSTVIIQINFASASLVPDLSNPFWETPQSWTFLAFAPGIATDENLTCRLSDQNIFSFAEAGQFDFTSDGVLTWTPLPEPSTWMLTAFGIAGFVVLTRRRSQ